MSTTKKYNQFYSHKPTEIKGLARDLYPFAACLAQCIGQHDRGKWRGFISEDEQLQVTKKTSDQIVYSRKSGRAHIVFSDIRVTGYAKDPRFHTPIKGKSKKIDAVSQTIINNSDIPISQMYSATFTEGSTALKQFRLLLEQSLQQEISYGGTASPVSGTTTIGFRSEQEYTSSNETSEEVSRTVEQSIDVPPKTRVRVSTTREIADYKQRIELWGEIDFKVKIYTKTKKYIWGKGYRTVDDWKIYLDSRKEIADYLSGNGETGDRFSNSFNNDPAPSEYATMFLRSALQNSKIDRTIEFQNASFVNININNI